MLPITHVQILWVNIITVLMPALALAFEPHEADVKKRPPGDPDEPIISSFLIWRIPFVATIAVMATFGLFLWNSLHGASIEAASTAAVNTTIFLELF